MIKTKEEVITFINVIMLVHNSDKCKDDCATTTCKYILQEFRINTKQSKD